MPFFENLLNSIPVVGHAKGVLHYVCGDEEGGDKAILEATRAAAVVGAGAVGALAGPVGAIAAGAVAGAVYDTGAAIVTDGKQVAGVAKICQNPGEIGAWVGAGVEMAFDGFAGIGAGGLGQEAGKKMAKKAVEHVAKKEAEKLVAGVAALALKAGFKNCREPARASGGRRKSTADYSSKKQKHNGGGDGGGGAGGNQGAKGDADKGCSKEPDDRRDGSEEKKKECQGATMQQLKEFIRIVEAIGEFMRLVELKARHDRPDLPSPIDRVSLETINYYFQEFISAAIPLMNDPTVELLTIRGGLLDIVMDNGNRVGSARGQAALLSRVIQHSVITNARPIRQRCSRMSCRFCTNMRHAPTGWTGNCETRNVIYSFYCNDCHRIVYAGQTTRPLRIRIGEHLRNDNSALHSHIASTAGHRNATSNLLDMFNIIIMWTSSAVDDTELDDDDMKRVLRNWEVLMQWLTEAHKSQGGESKR